MMMMSSKQNNGERGTFSKVFEREEGERNYTSEEGGMAKNGNTQTSSFYFRFLFFALKCAKLPSSLFLGHLQSDLAQTVIKSPPNVTEICPQPMQEKKYAFATTFEVKITKPKL